MSTTKGVLVDDAGAWSDWLETNDGGATVIVQHGDNEFTGTITLQVRPPTDVDGEAWGDSNEGAMSLATFTAPTNFATDSPTTNRMHGIWHVRIGAAAAAISSGQAKCWIGVRSLYEQ